MTKHVYVNTLTFEIGIHWFDLDIGYYRFDLNDRIGRSEIAPEDWNWECIGEFE